MANSDERMLILKMLQEGKITAEEASRLLEALDGGAKQAQSESAPRQQQKQATFQDEVANMRERIHEWKREFKKNYNQNDFDRAVDEFSVKVEKLGKNVAATTFGIVDKVIDFMGSFVDTSSFNIFGSLNVVEKSFEAAAADGIDLEIEGVNGYIAVKKHSENKIIVRSKVRSPLNDADAILQFKEAEGAVQLKLGKTGNISVSHEVFLPAVKFKNVKLVTTNGRITGEDCLAESFESTTRNAHIDLIGVKSDRVSVNTKNARIQLSYIAGREVFINTNNSVIDIKNIKAGSINAVTMNGRISVENAQNHEDSPEANMFLKTTNGGIKVNMNDTENRGYKVKAQTTNGGINLLIPEITYSNINKHSVGGSFVEAESRGYECYPQKVSINAETINGYIEIVK